MADTYKVTMRTPIGKKTGTIRLNNENGVLSGYIKAMGDISSFKYGRMKGNSFEFSGVLNAGFFHFDYQAKGQIDGNALTAVAATNFGNFQISGLKVDG